MKIYVDGTLYAKEDAKVSVFDHGFLYGDGVFEGIRAYDGTVFRLREHIDRLYQSAKTIALEIPFTREEMTQAVLDTVAANEKRDAYIRLVVSRGPGDLGIDPANCSRPTVVIICAEIKLYPKALYDSGAPIVTSSVRRIPIQCLDPRIKSLNYLNNIMAKIDARRAGALEAVMLNHQGRVAECTADNLFFIAGGVLKTPDLMNGALPGITRATVLELGREFPMGTEEGNYGLHDLYNADEVFLTGTGAEIMPVISVDGRQIGDGKPGALTKKLMEAFRHRRTRDGIAVPYAAGVAKA
ncbi:MAG TPA: branched-chain-amino-acid transaminase [Candidatus Polarisedimenticolaceae bacterium]|nr:branched-chain-amino-acid transaminase [Candidatus Polarisedimenticolaceae bacterium]